MPSVPFLAGLAVVIATLATSQTGRAGQQEDFATLAEQREALLTELEAVHRLSAAQVEALRAGFSSSKVLGQGNPSITRHPMSRQQCRDRLVEHNVDHRDPQAEQICGGPHMAPLYDPATQSASAATVCIDRFEFPDIPCAFPVVWVRANEAAEICEAVGKRLCDAHEWEGACAGRLESSDYRFDLAAGRSDSDAVRAMRDAHNRARAGSKSWSYGTEYQAGVCAAASQKSDGCDGGNWQRCGSNTYPAGAFSQCRSPLGVYDTNGNAAEHMNLPLDPSQLASQGNTTLGVTEMKGSWFIFDRYRAHEDWCRWRAPYWHGGRVRDPNSHHNYHLGFRCFKTLDKAPGDGETENRP